MGREREFWAQIGHGQCGGSRARCRNYWALTRARKLQRVLNSEGLADREELGSNDLLICNPNPAQAAGAEIQLRH
jgi:hypothetical protein